MNIGDSPCGICNKNMHQAMLSTLKYVSELLIYS